MVLEKLLPKKRPAVAAVAVAAAPDGGGGEIVAVAAEVPAHHRAHRKKQFKFGGEFWDLLVFVVFVLTYGAYRRLSG